MSVSVWSVWRGALLLAGVLAVRACDYSACLSDAVGHEDDFVRCDMCNCEEFDDLSGGSGTCDVGNDELYDCYIKYDREEFTLTCALRMKIGYILMFVFISLFGCCACIYCCSLGEKRYHSQQQPPPNDTTNLNAYLIQSEQQCSSQPVVVVQSTVRQDVPIAYSKPIDDQY